MSSNNVLKFGVNTPIASEKPFLIKLLLIDGSSQLVQITPEEASNYGIKAPDNNEITEITQTTETFVNGAQNVQQPNILDVQTPNTKNDNINEKTPNFVYKIMKPEDLNLKPVSSNHAARGRPRKKYGEQVKQEPPQKYLRETSPPIIKQVRTRSGRITKPPRHIEQDFKKIDGVDEKNQVDLKTTDFQPLKNNGAMTEPLIHLQQHTKRRMIPPRFRCPTCNKAYLGRIRMLTHLTKYPDHGSVPSYCKLEHNATWNFLILTSQKFRGGSRAFKFCQELSALLHNVRILAKFLFKPVENGETSYAVDNYLGHVFGIQPGDYSFNENELGKDVSLYAYLESSYLEDDRTDVINTINESAEKFENCNKSKYHKDVSLYDFLDRNYANHKNSENESINSLKAPKINKDINVVIENNKNTKHKDDNIPEISQNKNVHETLDSLDYIINDKKRIIPRDITNALEITSTDTQNKMNNLNITNQIETIGLQKDNKELLSKTDVCSSEIITSEDNLHIISNSKSLTENNCYVNIQSHVSTSHHTASVKYDTNQKHDFLNNQNINFDNINHHLLNVIDGNERLNNINYDLNVNVKQKNVYENNCLDVREQTQNLSLVHKHNSVTVNKTLEKDKKHESFHIHKEITLHNALLPHDVDELMLDNVDAGQVSHILDTSSNSDDIMNVDQFVNERFKKLTEPDIELQNTSLHIDLPPLDMFQFHTS